ncbi:hypothetical protein KI387_028555, partial [Taxus chinensis]
TDLFYDMGGPRIEFFGGRSSRICAGKAFLKIEPLFQFRIQVFSCQKLMVGCHNLAGILAR